MKTTYRIAAALLALAALTLAPKAQAADLAPSFGYLAPGWLPVQSFDLSGVWGAFGFQETGVSYYSVGGPANAETAYWERFDPLGTTYEAFFGAYVIQHFKYASEWHSGMTAAEVQDSANELVALGNVDQFAWLSFYDAPFGGPTGSSMVPGSMHIAPAANGFFLVTFEVNTFSDLGSGTPPAPFVPPYGLYMTDVPAFQPIVAEAFVLITYDAPSGDFLAIYGSGANYHLSDGEDKNTPLSTLVQIGAMMAATTFH
jgi:hypothetical protein